MSLSANLQQKKGVELNLCFSDFHRCVVFSQHGTGSFEQDKLYLRRIWQYIYVHPKQISPRSKLRLSTRKSCCSQNKICKFEPLSQTWFLHTLCCAIYLLKTAGHKSRRRRKKENIGMGISISVGVLGTQARENNTSYVEVRATACQLLSWLACKFKTHKTNII